MSISRIVCLATLAGAAFLSTATAASDAGLGASAEPRLQLIAQPSQVSPEVASIVGSWSMTYDWFCDGADGTATWTINADGTFVSSGGSTGTWVQVDRKVTFNYSTGTVYKGKVKADITMKGKQRDTHGNTGCFSAVRL
jgi:hypothetical protein